MDRCSQVPDALAPACGDEGERGAQRNGHRDSAAAISGMLRNCSTIALPPTGRSAPVIAASTGIEPLFLLTDPHQPGAAGDRWFSEHGW